MKDAESLNRSCDCSGTDLPRLRQELDGALVSHLPLPILDSHPHLFADAPVFLDSAHLLAMQSLIDAVHAAARRPGYLERVLANAPDIARLPQAPLGVFTAFDFHITASGPKLIEINTNAGGALLNAHARRAQPPCCDDPRYRVQPDSTALESAFVEMFRNEWRLSRGEEVPLRSIAIVDSEPEGQYLYPEFVLIRNLLAAHGIDAVIADPRELHGRRFDLIYNRLTDFYLEEPANLPVRKALIDGSAVITPHPRAYAVFANKRNLALLSNPEFLRSIGTDPVHIDSLLASIPRTECLADGDESWWTRRKNWFFKPAEGYGSRGSYRGDKLTRRVFAEIVKGRYVAQELTPPGERWRTRGTAREAYKVDIRAYTYDGRIQLVAARMYQGQTTNFRTAGGGFAPVYEITGS